MHIIECLLINKEIIGRVLLIFLILLLTSLLPIIVAEINRKDIERFLCLLAENFHLNNASVFIGYTVFDFNVLFLIMYIFSFVMYLIEHFFINEDKKKGKFLRIFQIVLVILGLSGQIGCAYLIMHKPAQ